MMRYVRLHTKKSCWREYITVNAFEFIKNNTANANTDIWSNIFFIFTAVLIGALYNYSEKRSEIVLLLIILTLLRYIVMEKLLQKN